LYADDTAVIFHASNVVCLQMIINKYFEQYAIWCLDNGIVVNPSKSNYLAFNDVNVSLTINGHVIERSSVVKYLGIYIDDKLLWSHHVDHVYKICCQRIGMFKKVLSYLPKHVVLLYYNAFVKSCFSYCICFWFNNNRSGKYKLINKIDKLISLLAKLFGNNERNFVCNSQLLNVNNAYKLQSLSFMYDVCSNRLTLPFFPINLNSSVHEHNTRSMNNLHIDCITMADYRNFMYQCTVIWNSIPLNLRLLPRRAFLRACKTLMFTF
jgi:hypothetical protein